MNKMLSVHGAWVVVATIAFIVGATLFPADNDSSDRGGVNGGKQAASPPGSGGATGTGSVVGWSAKVGEGSDTRGYRGSIAPLSDQDIASLGAQFRSAASPIDRRLAFSRLLEGLTAENALLVREQIAHMDQRSAEFREFHYAWGAVAGADAAMFGAGTPEDDMSPALAGWAGADPSAALAWFDGLDLENDAGFDLLLKDRKIPADALRGHLMRGLAQGLADSDPDAASDFVYAMMEAGNKGAEHMMHTVAQAVMRTDGPAEAAAWAEGLPEGAPRSVAMHRLANGYANEDPTAAAAWVEKIADEPHTAGVIAEVGVTWSRKDPQAALEWMTHLPEGDGQNAGMHRTLNEWAGRDPTAASEFLVDMPASDAKDSAISGFTGRLAREDPQAALQWAETISSDGQRLEATINAGRTWARKDATAAAEWVVSSGLPENVQHAIMNPPRRDDPRRELQRAQK